MKKQAADLYVFVLLMFMLCAGGCTHPLMQETAAEQDAAFAAVVLGTAGGLDEANLSAYLLAPAGSAEYIALDAGTLYAETGRTCRS